MRAKGINKYARDLVRKFHGELSSDFAKNKELVKKIEPSLSKRQVNELAGYVTKIMKKYSSEE